MQQLLDIMWALSAGVLAVFASRALIPLYSPALELWLICAVAILVSVIMFMIRSDNRYMVNMIYIFIIYLLTIVGYLLVG